MSNAVFISNKSIDHDYSSAAQFGAIRYVTQGNYPVFKTTRLLEEIQEALAWSKNDDYLLLSGSATVAGLCLVVWLEMHGVANILLWDRSQDTYVMRAVEKSDVRLGIERARTMVEQTGRAT